MSWPSRRTVPTTRVRSIRSFMRLRARRNVDLPHPDGPMNAVTDRAGTASVMSNSACVAPYQNDKPRTSSFVADRLTSADARPTLLRSEMIAEYERVDTRAPQGVGGSP